ncbi:MAG: hypothetical protein ACT4P7_23690 [Gemmatimonadaceae bacterium]
MPRLSRRTFVGWLAAAGVLIGVRRASAAPLEERDGSAQQPGVLPEASLLALAQAVLPMELGAEGTAKAAREFSRWIVEYRPGAELLHAYGSDAISFAGPSPLDAWRTQLRALESQARTKFGQAWPALGVHDRQALVRAAIAGQRITAMPNALRAPHVSIAVMSHFFGSSLATDLCHGVQIGRNQCRPLVHNSRQPLPAAAGGGA